MADLALVVGGAGTGKTTRLMDLLGKIIGANVDPHDVGFVSYTRAAVDEASSRAADQTGISPKSLHDDGWFRTLHSVAFRCLGVRKDEMVTDDAGSRDWFRERLDPQYDADDKRHETKSDLELSLPLWDAARQRIEPFHETHARAERAGAILPTLESAVTNITRYEQAKRLDGLYDFTDLLTRYAGIRCDPEHGVDETTPEGFVPNVEAWLCDESQDNSALMDRCIRRLIAPARWAYLVGDPFQAIYGFSGSNPALFQRGDFVRREVLGQSYRCPESIMDLGEQCLRNCSDYWDRKIKPASHEGEIKSGDIGEIYRVDQYDGTTLLLARTNYVARRHYTILKDIGVPYAATDRKTQWTATKRNAGIKALYRIQHGATCFEDDWASILALDDLPVKQGSNELLTRGTKAAWRKRKIGGEVANLDDLGKWGATPTLVNRIRSGEWMDIIPFAKQYCAAVKRYGQDAVDNPQITVSTIHGAKGQEADNVLLLTTTSGIVARAAEDPMQLDEEYRLAYVACTRARYRLTVVNEYNERHRMRVE